MSDSNSPRLLVATEFPPNAPGGGPAVVRQMLKEWPSQRLFWWSCSPDTNCLFRQDVAAHRVAHLPGKLRPQRRFARQKAWLVDSIWTHYASAHLRQALLKYQPDVVWAIPHDWSITPLASALSSATTGLHVTLQDYVDVHGHAARFGARRCSRMASEADRLYKSATTRDATSHPMIADLRLRTGMNAAQMLHAGLEQHDFAWLGEKQSSSGSEIRIAHAGTILVEDAFLYFVNALRRVRETSEKPIQLDLFGAHSYAARPWFDSGWMVEHGNMPEPELLQKLRQCTWGFAPMALTDDDPRYNRFSFPTKFITYLAAGLPVITVGHPESSVARMAAQYQVGILETGRDSGAFAMRLGGALAVQDPWEHHKAEIVRCASVEFDASRMRARLYDCFRACASAGK